MLKKHKLQKRQIGNLHCKMLEKIQTIFLTFNMEVYESIVLFSFMFFLVFKSFERWK